MDRAPLRPPAPRTLGIVALLAVLLGGLWLHARGRRLEVEHRAAAVAGAIAGRRTAVRCPGPIRRRLLYEINEGVVRFSADGRPADETHLSGRACDGLRTVLDDGPRLEAADRVAVWQATTWAGRLPDRYRAC
ncbi:hypothetical protein FSW04_16510 [Baekduia soli]|uniref:Uncharacterized protein n=1 Tax=Baekduia soli TaxID=496014 RepID=A0A5B8U7V9_9ACTN|nr:hypothetical protein [Baekduia soli]QEC49015.1 hypothetical protein FSW04_16510 [Baekduia soli]